MTNSHLIEIKEGLSYCKKCNEKVNFNLGCPYLSANEMAKISMAAAENTKAAAENAKAAAENAKATSSSIYYNANFYLHYRAILYIQ